MWMCYFSVVIGSVYVCMYVCTPVYEPKKLLVSWYDMYVCVCVVFIEFANEYIASV